MRYTVTHSTKYVYGEVVPLGHHLAHLRPRKTSRQTVEASEITIAPVPAVRRDRVDFFGNLTTFFSIQEPHESLHVVSRSTVDVAPFKVPPNFVGDPWEVVPAIINSRRDPESIDATQYRFDSPFVPISPELADYARPSFGKGQPLLTCLIDLTRRIHSEFIFDTTATSVGTPILTVLRNRRGVCQDFAQLQIGCLRALGLAARYVSGYLVTRPPPGVPRLVGADVSHAWISVLFPGFGWIDFDPTNQVIPSSDHIVVGWARDYEDIGPVKGVIVGGHRHSVKVSVDVSPILPSNESTSSSR